MDGWTEPCNAGGGAESACHVSNPAAGGRGGRALPIPQGWKGPDQDGSYPEGGGLPICVRPGGLGGGNSWRGGAGGAAANSVGGYAAVGLRGVEPVGVNQWPEAATVQVGRWALVA